ncbi:hypothetical protein L596_030765 [Steinernema carpocapsae]|uniref:Phosphatidylethanolamine-binding protein n=1 Tax=Steinernema carpocapsae TaxID=34508 RepID=A0A4U5LNP4_STECR|nr:hypothetical protein L596_030765 [Steinernema carpocapsae]
MAVQAFQKHEVIPDVLKTAPLKVAKVVYDSGVEVNLGAELTPTQVKNPPTVTWEANPEALYCLVLTDPDAPTRADPKWREWHHWIVANIPGCDVSKGDVFAEYVGAGPPEKTGLHRYVFVVYKQAGKLANPEYGRLKNNSTQHRNEFKTQLFAEKNGLGDPIAGNFFQAQYDDYVPQLYKQFTAKY